MGPSRPVLAFDFGSPRASAAVAVGGRLLAARDDERGDGASDLLRLIAAILDDAGLKAGELGGVVSLAGPGSFTGVRIACAAATALAQAWALPAGGVSTLAALASAAPDTALEVVACVDALRGEWFVERFGPARHAGLRCSLAPAALWRADAEIELGGTAICGFAASRLAAQLGSSAPLHEPVALAGVVARAATSDPDWSWRVDLLERPLHLRAAATTRPKR